MIAVTRLNGSSLVVNVDQIRSVEANPDTTIRFMNGEHLVVCETLDEIVAKAIAYGRHLRTLEPPAQVPAARLRT
jgi:flagellar protein FlbD